MISTFLCCDFLKWVSFLDGVVGKCFSRSPEWMEPKPAGLPMVLKVCFAVLSCTERTFNIGSDSGILLPAVSQSLGAKP